MDATTATCTVCSGEGTVDYETLAETDVCDHCDGAGECDCRDCLDTAAENAFSDQCESEPPLSADERHQIAWREKQQLRR